MQTQQTLIDGVTIVYEWPWLLIDGHQLHADQALAVATFFQTAAGRAAIEELRADRASGDRRERAAGR